MQELCKLVLRLRFKQIDYAMFRQSMVASFLSRRSGNSALDAAALRIDIVCADFSQGLIGAEDLDAYLWLAIQDNGSGTSMQVGQFDPGIPVTAARKSSSVVPSLLAMVA